jgi:hypothetical protein
MVQYGYSVCRFGYSLGKADPPVLNPKEKQDMCKLRLISEQCIKRERWVGEKQKVS